MKHSAKVGVRFGMTSAIITTLGLMVGLNSGTGSKLVVIGAILLIAIGDSLSDALAIHISEESEAKHTLKEIWTSTYFTFLSKFVVTMTFVIPVLLLPLTTAIIISIVWGLGLIGIVSYKMAIEQKIKPWKVISEHMLIASFVIVVTHFIGLFVAVMFG